MHVDNAQQLMARHAIVNFKCGVIILAIKVLLWALNKKRHPILSRLSLSLDGLTGLQS